LPSQFGWSDIGSWKSLQEYLPKDKHGNALVGDVLCQNTRNSLLFSQSRLVASNNISDIVLVETPDAVFISDLETSRDVKQIFTHLKQLNRPEYRVHLLEKNAWGSIKTLEKTANENVIRVTIKPGKTYVYDPAPKGRVYINILAGNCQLSHNQLDQLLNTGDVISMDTPSAYLITNNSHHQASLIITHQMES